MAVVFLEGRCCCFSTIMPWQKTHEAETARSSSRWIDHYNSIRYCPKLLKVISKLVRRRVLRQPTNKQFVCARNSTFHVNGSASDCVLLL
jgi:hypothetical protein